MAVKVTYTFVCDYCHSGVQETYGHEMGRNPVWPKLPQGWRQVDVPAIEGVNQTLCCENHKVTVEDIKNG